ncbi:MAG: prolyl oligopeptidase family serine peptidase [Gemmatimonas sp.]
MARHVSSVPVSCLAMLLALPLSHAFAQSSPTSSAVRKVLSVNDYARWRNIENAQISGDGKWVTYGLRFTNTTTVDAKPVLHILNLATNQDVEIANATQAAFSPDSRWIVYQIEPPPVVRGGRGGAPGAVGDTTVTGAPPTVPGVTPPIVPDTTNGRPPAVTPPARRYELRELATGRVQSWQDMQSATFSPTASHVMLRRRAPGATDAGGGRGGGGGPPAGPVAASAASGAPRGADVILHDLTTGRSQFLGSVGDVAFNKKGDLLAYTVDAIARDGNGLFVLDLQSGRTEVLDNDARNYNRLSWSFDGTGLAVLKGREVTRMRERDNTLIVFGNVPAALGSAEVAPAKLDPTTAKGFPKGFVISDRAALAWSDDNQRVFLGIIPQRPAADTGRRRSTDSIADVDVWRAQDERIQSEQMIRIEAERNFTFRQGFDVASSRYIPLTDSTMRELELPMAGTWAVGRDARSFISDYKRPAADIYRVNTTTGERTLMLKGQLTGASMFGISPDGRQFMFWKDNKYQAYDLERGASRTLGAGSALSFVDMEYDHPGPRPSYGVAGYTPDGNGVVVQHRFDLWLFPMDGTSVPRNLTNGLGSKNEIEFRYVRTEPIDSSMKPAARVAREIDLSKSITLSAFGEFTKKSGFYQLNNGQLKELLYTDASYSTPVKAAKSDKFLFTRQTFAEFPDLQLSGVGFTDAKKISNANPQQAEYAWGRRVLFDFKNKDGKRLQGILALPDDYKPGEKRPMLVSFYEKNSQNMNRYPSPSFLTGMGASPIEAVSRGYITMMPDVHFRTGSSHSDMLECVEAATRKVIEMGYADPKRIGLNGHSYGGEGAAFIGTRSRLFAAVGMGAGVTDLFTDFSQSWGWSYQVTGGSGRNGNDYYLYGQGRWGISPWDNPDLFHFESALTHVRETTSPFLIMHGTADPTVSFSEGMNFYNALRYNGKSAVMLAYPGEGHGLRGLANRKDLTIRYFQFFDHYLKGSAAPKWMTDGVPFIAKETVKTPN